MAVIKLKRIRDALSVYIPVWRIDA